jgi:phosphatidylserine/phosphatidylglycerophosphate/cardiolipin synthase-like enzyme
MIDQLARLTEADTRELIRALKSNRLHAPYLAQAVERVVTCPLAATIAAGLEELAALGFTSPQIATSLELALLSRTQPSIGQDYIDLVTTGPEVAGVSNRDTSVVVRELFAHAHESIFLAGYAVYQGMQVFAELADRMEQRPGLQVRFVLDIPRPSGDLSTNEEVVRRFVNHFRRCQWPELKPLPELYYDPRSLEMNPARKTCMHAKCVVVDRKLVFVSSANFTEAAQERNLEVGLLVRSPSLAAQLQGHFDCLIGGKRLLPA